MAALEHNMTDYEAEYASFHLDIPSQYNFAFDTIERWAADDQRLAMLWVGQQGQERHITFAEFAARSSQVANGLTGLGIAKGERAIVVLPRIPEWWEALLGLMKMGAVSVPGTTQLTAKDFAFRANAAGAGAVITDADGAAKFDQVRDQCPSVRQTIVVGEQRDGWVSYESQVGEQSVHYSRDDLQSSDPCLIYFTSGTVGNPKMVLHSHAYPLGHTITGKYWLDLRPGDLHYNASDTGWAKAAWSSLFGPWLMGAALMVQDARGKFNPRDLLSLLANYPVTTLCAPPTIYRVLVQEDLSRYRFQALRHCVGAGEPLNPEVIDAWRAATGLTIRDGYGQTETVLVCGNFPPIAVQAGSMGKPSPGYVVSVVDDNGNEVAAGNEGDIAVKVNPMRPPGLFQGYYLNPEATQSAIRGNWYITGDRAYRDEAGYFWFVGRADDVIISAGYRIGPFEVESALVEHPAVVEAAVVASPDETRGEVVKAFVILAQGYAPSDALVTELQEHVKSVTAPYKYPREIEFVTELPKTISGKIRRVELRERERQRKLSHTE
jgi:acyl-coenzyme A synthetase/AMP-(fatty) acid ligase